MAEVRSCPDCAAAVPDSARFCQACGADLQVRTGGTVDSLPANAGPQPCRGCQVTLARTERYCPRCGLRSADPTDRVETDLGALAGVSDRGLVHARNEDAMALGYRHDAACLAMVVCDGVSTVRAPEQAARIAASAALGVLLGQPPAETTDTTAEANPAPEHTAPANTARAAARRAQRLVEAAVARAASEVGALAVPGEPAAPSCTLVCALVGPGPMITIGWLGDSRAYWLAAPGAEEPSSLLTTDHSWATAMVNAGILDDQTARRDPRAHALTRWLGPDTDTEPEVYSWQPAGPGSLLLCTDGLWNYYPEPSDLAAKASVGTTPLAAARTLTQHALAAGGRDNITVCLATLAATHPRSG